MGPTLRRHVRCSALRDRHMWRGLVFALVLFAVSLVAGQLQAEPALVVLIRPSAQGPIVNEAITRIRGELVADGFDVSVVDAPPGADPASFNIAVVRDTLTLSGEKPRAPGEVKPEAFHREERAAGKFARSIALPAEIDESKVKAEYKNGLLLITAPKSEKAKPRQISVQVA